MRKRGERLLKEKTLVNCDKNICPQKAGQSRHMQDPQREDEHVWKYFVHSWTPSYLNKIGQVLIKIAYLTGSAQFQKNIFVIFLANENWV